MARWVWPTAAGVVTSATGVVINVATDLADNALAWVGVGLLTALGVGIGIAAQRADQRHREVTSQATAAVPPAAAVPAPAAAAVPPAAAEPAVEPPAAPPQPAPAATAAAEPPPAATAPQPAPQTTVYYNHSTGNNVGPVIQVGQLHGKINYGNTVNQSATAHDGGTVYQAGRDVRLDGDR
ncbi:hypothetical protein [Saccharothrix variisporea]|uniref:Uncharacterized protein n=1 Tax=Saccharothrix variisporea TaxID=543527 RepID=A0A495XHD1_9PSEU|nr:hypothetical protein [Saccharothrix variisporea]RKT73139.1 hypothetical protein DFJ66_6466 [Saccharothrix variisporea]